MAVLTLNRSSGPTATVTFNSIRSSAGDPGSAPGPHVVMTSVTLTNSATLTTTTPWSHYVDPTTATTIRVPLGHVASLI